MLLAYKCGMHSLLIKIRPVKAEALTVNAFAFTGHFSYINHCIVIDRYSSNSFSWSLKKS